jgi:hypothetical protein
MQCTLNRLPHFHLRFAPVLITPPFRDCVTLYDALAGRSLPSMLAYLLFCRGVEMLYIAPVNIYVPIRRLLLARACPEFIPESCLPDSQQGSVCLLALELTLDVSSPASLSGIGRDGCNPSSYHMTLTGGLSPRAPNSIKHGTKVPATDPQWV